MDRIKYIFGKAPFSITIISIWLIVSFLAPLFVHETSEGIFPALIPYGPSSIDLANAGSLGPFDEQNIESNYFRHWLGTDEIGRDVLAQLIHGSTTAILIGFFSILISAFLGIIIGSLPAYIGDRSIKVNTYGYFLILTLSLFLFIYLLFVYPWSFAPLLLSITFLTIAIAGLSIAWRWLLKKNKSLKKDRFIPLDLIAGRMIETMDSLPILFIIISLSAIIKASTLTIILIIGISNWASIARYARSETIKVKNLGYIESARALGMSQFQIIRKHLLPNAVGSVIISLAFGIAAAILIEATLSFLGLGIGVEDASWGSMMAEARKSPDAWWLAIFPGLAIFLVVYSCNQLGEKLSK